MENKDNITPDTVEELDTSTAADKVTADGEPGAGDANGVESTSEHAAPRTALEFEISEDEGGLVFFSEADISPDVPATEDTPSKKKDTSKPEPIREEFSLPDSFEPDGRYSSSFVEDPVRLRTTYVPRFTEVSDTYRMKDDPRPRTDGPKEPTVTVKPERKIEISEKGPLDPTAEIDEGGDDRGVVVTSSPVKSDEPTDESIKLYKFASPASDEESVPEEKSEPSPVTVEETVIDEPIVEAVAEEPVKEDEPYEMPNPDSEVRVLDFTPAAVEDDGPDTSADITSSKREFTSPIQRDSFKDKFLDSIMSVRVRLIAALIIFLALTVGEVVEMFGGNPLSFLGLERVAYAAAIVDIEFSVCLFVLAIPELIRAFGQLGKKTVTPELFLPVSLGILIAYTAVVVTSGSNEYLTFGMIYSIQVIAAIGGTYYRTTGDFFGFKTVTKNTVKNVLEKKLTRELPRENMALDGAVDEYNSKTARIFRTVFVSDFFKHTSQIAENSYNTLMIMGCGLGISVVAGAVAFFLFENSLVMAFQTLAMVFLLACPAASILAHKLPYNHACRLAASENSAFIGENALVEGADVDVIAYDDTEIFGVEDVSIRKVHLYGRAYNTPKAMKQMYSLFAVVGGPLEAVFTASLDRKCSLATDVVIEPDGISGMLEGHRISAGTEEYMLRHKVKIPSDDYRTKTTGMDSTKVMYGAEDGEVYVKFFIRYSFTEEFTMLLPYLKEQKIIPLIYTRDPNINVELLRILTMGEDVIRVMKKDTPRTTEEKTYRHLSAGIVTLGDKSNAINMVLLAKKYTAFQSGLAMTELISMVVGAVLAAIISIGGMASSSVPGLVLGLSLWQIAWVIVLYVRSRMTFKIAKN